MNATIISAPIAHAFDPALRPMNYAAPRGDYQVGETRIDFALIIGNQTGAVLVSGQVTIASLTANEKTALYRHLVNEVRS